MYEGDIQQFVAAPVVETEAQSIIRRARSLLADPLRWTQGGDYTELREQGAAFCLYGAIMHVSGVTVQELRDGKEINGAVFDGDMLKDTCPAVQVTDRYLTQAVQERSAIKFVIGFNDDNQTDHADVLAVLDRAYTLAGGSPQASPTRDQPALPNDEQR